MQFKLSFQHLVFFFFSYQLAAVTSCKMFQGFLLSKQFQKNSTKFTYIWCLSFIQNVGRQFRNVVIQLARIMPTMREYDFLVQTWNPQ